MSQPTGGSFLDFPLSKKSLQLTIGSAPFPRLLPVACQKEQPFFGCDWQRLSASHDH